MLYKVNSPAAFHSNHVLKEKTNLFEMKYCKSGENQSMKTLLI